MRLALSPGHAFRWKRHRCLKQHVLLLGNALVQCRVGCQGAKTHTRPTDRTWGVPFVCLTSFPNTCPCEAGTLHQPKYLFKSKDEIEIVLDKTSLKQFLSRSPV